MDSVTSGPAFYSACRLCVLSNILNEAQFLISSVRIRWHKHVTEVPACVHAMMLLMFWGS